MKKIILILFLFLLCISCYLIYNKTKKNKLYITAIGDNLTTYKYIKDNKVKTYNTKFTNNDLRINDLLNIIKYNHQNNLTPEIHQTLKKSDIIIISIGMNDIYYKLDNNPKEIYTFLNNMLNNYEEILKEINKYNYKQVFILGYYNITNENNDIFNYINYKLEKISSNYKYTCIDLNKTINKNPKYLLKQNKYYLNEEGFKQISNLIVENLKKYDII